MSEHIIDTTPQAPLDPFLLIIPPQPQLRGSHIPFDLAQAVNMHDPPIGQLNARVEPMRINPQDIIINIFALPQIEDADNGREADAHDNHCQVKVGGSMILGSMALALVAMSPETIILSTTFLLTGTLLTTHRPTFSAKLLNYKCLLSLVCVINSLGIGILYGKNYKDGAIVLGVLNALAGIAGMGVIQSAGSRSA